MEKFKILLFVTILLSFVTSKAQYTPMTAYGYTFKRLAADSTLQIPTVCGLPTLRSTITNKAAIAFDSCNNRFYQYNPKTLIWSYLGSASLSGINLQSVTDSGNTTTNNINIISNKYKSTLSGQQIGFNDSVTNIILLPIHNSNSHYFSLYKTSLTTSWDTLATLSDLRSSGNSGTVTSVGSGYGLTGGPITTSGTLVVDTATLSSKYALKTEVKNGRFGNDTATVVMAKVHNNSGTTLTNGKVVFLATSGTNSDAPSVRLANNKNDSTSANTFGFVSGTIASNDTGWVVLSGKIEKLNTSAFSNGDVIYLDSVSGNWTKTKPVAPYHMVYLGVVIKANAGNGSIFVKCQNGYELDEIHDVLINGKINNQILAYSDTLKVWKNRSIYSVVDTSNVIATKTNVANKVNISDTANMLTNYAKTSAVNLKVNISDTANMLTNYAKTSAVNLKVNISDTANMLSKYIRKTDTATLSNRINLKVNISDTASMLTNYAKTSAVNLKVNISDTASMLSNYVRKDTSAFYLINDANTSNTTATNTNLTFSVGANETYRIMVAGTASKATTTTGMKIAIGAPTGATLKGVFQGGGAAASTALTNQILSAPNTLLASAFATGAGVEVPFRFEGVITTSSTTGSITLQFATVTSNTATIYAGTVMQLIKVKGL